MFQSRFNQAEESNLKTGQLKLSSLIKRGKRWKKSGQRLRHPWDTIKKTNICIVVAPEREREVVKKNI